MLPNPNRNLPLSISLWRALWLVPLASFAILFGVTASCMLGPRVVYDAWKEMSEL